MKALLLTLLCLVSTLVEAEQKIETIQLNHRLAVELLPEIQPFLPEKATARAFNDFIIVKADRAVIETIRQLINQLDTPAQRLIISVLRTHNTIQDNQSSQLSADVNIRDRDLAGSVAIQGWSTKDAKNKEQHFQAQGLAGKPIMIAMGQDIPQQDQYLVLGQHGSFAIESNTYYLNINSGFQAVARILPNHHAAIDIHPMFSHLSKQDGVIYQNDIITSISGPVGSWLELGKTDSEKNIEKHGSTSYHSHRQNQQTIYIKVEAVAAH